jgi:hypothetical protein
MLAVDNLASHVLEAVLIAWALKASAAIGMRLRRRLWPTKKKGVRKKRGLKNHNANRH